MSRCRLVLLLGMVMAGGCGPGGDPKPDEEACSPGATRVCYAGPAGTAEVGACRSGSQTCEADGSKFGPCVGDVTPAPESCVTDADEDCDGQTLDAEDGCVCAPMTTASCYTGPEGTAGVSACSAGTRACNALGTAYGPCAGEVVPKAEVCASPEDESCNGEAACSGAHVWSEHFGQGVHAEGNSVTTDSEGNVILTGFFQGAVDFGGGPMTSEGSFDAFLAKLDASGGHVWSKRFGDAIDHDGITSAARAATDSAGNIVLTGSFGNTVDFGGGTLTSAGKSDVFVAKFDASGAHVWSRGVGDESEQLGSGVATDSEGNVFLIGTTSGTVDFGGGPLAHAGQADAFIVKFDAAGGHVWSKGFGDDSDQRAGSVAVDSAGNVVLLGQFGGTVDFGGGPMTNTTGKGTFVVKFDAAGGHVWSKQLGEASETYPTGVAVDSAGDIVLTGSFEGSVDLGGGPLTSAGEMDIFVAKLDAAGNHVWSERFGDANDQYATSAAVDVAGNVVLTGMFAGSVDFGGGPLTSAGQSQNPLLSETFVAKLDAAGGHVWSKRFGDGGALNGVSGGKSVATDRAGNVTLTGTFTGSIDFGGGPLTGASDVDVFAAKLAP